MKLLGIFNKKSPSEIYKAVGEGTIDVGDILEILYEKKYEAYIPWIRRTFKFLEKSPKGEKIFINVIAHDRTGILADIGTLAKTCDINLVGIRTANTNSNLAVLKIRLRIFNFQQLKTFLENLPKIKNIVAIRRTTEQKHLLIRVLFFANIVYWITQPFLLYELKDNTTWPIIPYFLFGAALSIIVTSIFQTVSKYLLTEITKVGKLWTFCMVMNICIGALLLWEKMYFELPFHWIFGLCFIIIIVGNTFTEYYQYRYGD